MGGRIEHALLGWLEEGRTRLGQIAVRRDGDFFELRHLDDADATALDDYCSPEDALEIARWDAAGKYRPLKTAPTLRAGWRLRLRTAAELVLALEYFYPAMLASCLAAREKRLGVTPLRDTLARQSGMYAITRQATVEDAEAVIGRRCASDGGCLKTILWPVEDAPPRGLPPEKFALAREADVIPLPCAEGCNLLVAAIRRHLKRIQA